MEDEPYAAEIEAVRRDRRNLSALVRKAEALFAQGEHDTAINLLRTADGLVPSEYAVNRVLSGFLAGMKQFDEAKQLAMRAIEIVPFTVEARLHLAGILFTRQRYQEAMPHLLAYLTHEQATATGWHMLSIAVLQAGQPEWAIEAVRRAIELQPANMEYRLHLASLLTTRSRYGDALTELDIAATLAPSDARIPRSASGNHEALGDLTAAYHDAARACDLAPDNAEMKAHYDQLARRMGFFEAAPATAGLENWAVPVQKIRRVRPRPAGLCDRLRERGRIIYALVLRDMRTRHSRSQLGYLWSVFEPISHLLTLGVMFALINEAPPPIGTSLFEFYCSGLLPYLMFSHISTDVMGARSSSGAVLLLPKLRTTDVILSKTFLNLMTEIVVGCLVFTAFGAAGYRTLPAHLFPCAAGIMLLALLGMGIGTINMVIQNFFHGWETIFASIVRLLYFASGIYYTPISMPDAVRNFLEWNPVLQGVEVFRSGFFAEYDPFWINMPYLISWVLVSLVLGFGLEQTLRRRLRNQS